MTGRPPTRAGCSGATVSEALCHTCIALALSPDPDTKEVSEAVSQLEWLRSYLKGADSKMPAAHQARFRALAARYQQYGK